MQILRETGMRALAKAKELGPDSVLSLLEEKRLVGRGGAAYPTAKKWRIAKDTPADARYVICNADEGEPGTFKDRHILQYNPETVIEGTLIAAHTIGATTCFIYLRGEYDYLRERIETAISTVREHAGDDIEIILVRGAGAYICGEETAIIQSIMGLRGHPTIKPPYPPVAGLWGKPTIVNNVETLACAAQALLYDDWNPDLRLFSLTGAIRNPGVYELPLGITMRELLKIADPPKPIKALSFGCFGGIMPIDPELHVTTETICKENCSHGAFSVLLIDEDTNVIDICLSIARFYTYESCGKCTPCREGTIRMLNILKRIRNGTATREDLDVISTFASHVQETSLCGLGQTCGKHILTALEHFKEDFEACLP